MIKNIILNKTISIKEKIKRLIAYSMRKRGARILWNRHFKIVFDRYPNYNKPTEKSVEKAHKLYWKPFRHHINLATLRVSTNISGISDPKIIPEEIFFSDIEPTLTRVPSIEYLGNKSLYNRLFPEKIFPGDFFHNVDGEWLDKDLNSISFSDVKSIAQNLSYPVVYKPNRDSYGGKNVYFPKGYDELINLAENNKDFLVQEKIRQHHYFEQFNPHGLNTLRVNVYRSVSDNKLHVINVAMRMGLGGSLDNVTAGGIAARVNSDGFINGFAVDAFGKKYFRHPDTGVEFNTQIPNFKELNEISLKIAHRLFYSRLIAFDCCYDFDRNWRMIEINLLNASICFAQEHGDRFFGEFTDEVHDYCIKNHWILK